MDNRLCNYCGIPASEAGYLCVVGDSDGLWGICPDCSDADHEGKLWSPQPGGHWDEAAKRISASRVAIYVDSEAENERWRTDPCYLCFDDCRECCLVQWPSEDGEEYIN